MIGSGFLGQFGRDCEHADFRNFHLNPLPNYMPDCLICNTSLEYLVSKSAERRFNPLAGKIRLTIR